MDTSENKELELARRLVEETGANLFLTGKAGTGKTTFLRRLRERGMKRMVVLAPTGIAAINAGGATVHSFFQLSFGLSLPGTQQASGKGYDRFSKEKLRVIRTMDLLVIDEVSMVRADLLDAVDAALRRHRDGTRPFGGVQLLLIGDLQQLPPVVKEEEWQFLSQRYATPYFFDSHALREAGYETVELQRVYRQSEGEFLDILNSIRENRADASVLRRLNARYMPGFRPDPRKPVIRLVTHNRQAQAVNDAELAALPGREKTFRAETEGEFPETSYPAEYELRLKERAQVMFVKNDGSGTHRYYNGLLGEVTGFSADGITVRKADGSGSVCVGREKWENMKYTVSASDGAIREESVGSFSQFPLRAAWAITIHKSQGLTFDRAMIDASSSFAHGQTYVALSRCRTLDGLILETPLSERAIICDDVVAGFIRGKQGMMPGSERLEDLRKAYSVSLLDELFGFAPLRRSLDVLRRVLDSDFVRLYPRLVENYRTEAASFVTDVEMVSARFRNQYRALAYSEEGEEKLQQRVMAGAAYFNDRLEPLLKLRNSTPREHDNRAVLKQFENVFGEFSDLLRLKRSLLTDVAAKGFDVKGYLADKARAVLELEGKQAVARTARGERKRKKREKEEKAPKVYAGADVAHPLLLARLKDWRYAKMEALGVPAFTVIGTAALIAIANSLPRTMKELSALPGIGPVIMSRYGNELLAVVEKYCGGSQS